MSQTTLVPCSRTRYNMRTMDDAPTTYIIPKYLTVRARRLRWAARVHLLSMPLALWIPLIAGSRGVRAVIVSVPILVVLLALPQLAPLGAPRTMRRRYRRLTGQADLIILAGFCLLSLAIVTGTRLAFVALGTIALAVPVAAFLLLSPSVYLIPHPEDVQRP
jgi:hypothetical protein